MKCLGSNKSWQFPVINIQRNTFCQVLPLTPLSSNNISISISKGFLRFQLKLQTLSQLGQALDFHWKIDPLLLTGHVLNTNKEEFQFHNFSHAQESIWSLSNDKMIGHLKVKIWPSVDYFVLFNILYLWHSPPFWWKVEKCQICHLYHFRCRHIKLILIGPINGPFTPRVSCSNWIHMFGWHQMSSTKKSFRHFWI